MHKLLISTVFLSVALMLPSSASAASWLCGQAHAAHIQNESVVTPNYRYGWGLDFVLNSGMSTWVHFPVAAVAGKNGRYVALKFYTGSIDAWIDTVDVWVANSKVGSFSGLSWSGSPQWQSLDLGADYPLTSVGISVLIKAGVETMSHEFEFYSACVGFQ